jgi:hypothetical protein
VFIIVYQLYDGLLTVALLRVIGTQVTMVEEKVSTALTVNNIVETLKDITASIILIVVNY